MLPSLLALLIVALIAGFCLWFIFNRITCGKTESVRCMIGKTAIVTGGNSGIGYQVCLNLAARGCRVIIADKDNSEQTRDRIIKITRNPNIVSKILDLSSFKSVRKFAEEIIKSEDRLDVLVNNAGITASSSKLTEDGFNPILQVNHLGPFLLTHLLIDLLKKSAPSRIVFTSSAFAFISNLSLDNLDTFVQNNRFYSNSKLAVIITCDMFAEKLKHAGVTSNSLHPGMVPTNIFRKIESDKTISFNVFVLKTLCFFFGKSLWEGSQTTTHLAISEDIEGVTGKHFWDCRQFIKPMKTTDKELCRKIWELSEKYVGLLPHEKIE